MRKQEGRLSSSTSSIRASNYSVPRSYGPSLSSYRYSATSYTPGVRGYGSTTSSTSGASSESTNTSSRAPAEPTSYSSLTRSTTSNSATGSALIRSSSTAAYRSPYSAPSASRLNTSYSPSYSSIASSYTPSSTSSSNQNTLAPPASKGHLASQTSPTPSHQNSSTTHNSLSSTQSSYQPAPYSTPSSAYRSRSSSAASSYRNINVNQLNQQARERAERDEKINQYREWEEREKLREQEEPPVPLVRDFRKKMNVGSSSTSTPSAGYASFARAVSSRSELGSRNDMTTSITSMASTGSTPAASRPGSPPSVSVTLDHQRYMPTPSTSMYSSRTAHSTVERERSSPVVALGFTGLRNIGNTCFMNAVLQMLVNNIELRTYFLEKHYKSDINTANPLGFQGRLADAFADFMSMIWSGHHRAIEPAKIKELVAEKSSQFASYSQQDAHEFLSFLLDGLHEDTNRVKHKPMTSTVEGDGRPDLEVSSEAWRNHTLRNDSIFVDLFHGQLKSRLQCPNCNRVSITFDPFLYLPVPFPKIKKTTNIIFWPADPAKKPVKIHVRYASEGSIHELLSAIADMVRISPSMLRLAEVFSHRIQKNFKPEDRAADICSGDVLYAFQLAEAPKDPSDELVELWVVQRQLYPAALRAVCSECGKSNVKLKACQACYNAYYCNEECQLANWNNGGHRDECRSRCTADPVGQPFMLSFPRSQLNYANLQAALDARSRCSVTVEVLNTCASEDDLNGMMENNNTPVGAPPSFLRVNSVRKKKSPSPNAAAKKGQKLYLIRKIADAYQVLGDLLNDDQAVSGLASGSQLSINWYNKKNGKTFADVTTRQFLDFDEDRYSKNSSSIHCNGNSGDPSLQEMLGIFSETEHLKPEESWYCNRCTKHVEATKKLELYRLPPVLIVQLKRFVYTASNATVHRRSKDDRRVNYPITDLDMAPYLAETAPMEQPTKYDLCGVVCHSGSSHFGHYVGVTRLAGFDSAKTEIDWRLFDDSIVSKLTSSTNDLLRDDAYLLFYKQRGLATRSIFRKHYSCDPTEATADIRCNGNGDIHH